MSEMSARKSWLIPFRFASLCDLYAVPPKCYRRATNSIALGQIESLSFAGNLFFWHLAKPELMQWHGPCGLQRMLTWLSLYWQLLLERRRLQFVRCWLCVLWALTRRCIKTALWHCLRISIQPPSSARRCHWLVGGEQRNPQDSDMMPYAGRLLLLPQWVAAPALEPAGGMLRVAACLTHLRGSHLPGLCCLQVSAPPASILVCASLLLRPGNFEFSLWGSC